MNFEIKIKEGLGDVRFGMTEAEVTAIMGRADGVEHIENAADEPTTVLHYDELGLTLFLEGDPQVLACIDIANEGCTLFGKEVYVLDERTLVKLMVDNNFAEQDVDEEDWGERRVTFTRGNIDFYFDDGQMTSIIMGA